jgi:subtilisin family serine protease
MLLAIKSFLPLEKLKTHEFYHDDMIFYNYIPEIKWYYFIMPDELCSDVLTKLLGNDKDIIEFSYDIEGLTPNNIIEIIPTNANFQNQWGFRNIGQYGGFPGEDARITKAWTVEQGSFDIIVAVVDSGIDVDHECLVGHIYIDPSETVTIGFDADGNTYNNDFIGWNMETNNYRSYSTSHGTALASVITTNGNGLSGVTMKSRILPVAIGNIDSYDIPTVNFGYPCGNRLQWEDAYEGYYNTIPSSRVSQGIIYAANKGAHIITVAYSRGGTRKIGCCGTYSFTATIPDVRDAIKYAGKMGCVVVTAAGDWLVEKQGRTPTPRHGYEVYSEDCGGNEESVATCERNIFPGAYSKYFPFMINVTAHNNWGYLYYEKVITSVTPDGFGGWFKGCAYSKENVNIAAPGKDILVAMPNNQYGLAGGTSVAAAFVSGAAALVWSRNSYLKNYQIREVLQSSSRKNAYWAERVTCNGVLDVEAAIRNAFN